MQQETVVSGFLRSAELFPQRPAADVSGDIVTYSELSARAAAVAAALLRQDSGRGPQLTAVFGSRSVDTYAAILGILMRGYGYVPLNPRYPKARNREILERSGARAIVVSPLSTPAVEELLDGVADPPFLLPTPESDEQADALLVNEPGPSAPAYLLFTSGSTGRPKGVLVSHGNLAAFLTAVGERYELDETDRFSQLFDLTFDLSAFDMFVAWHHGACVCSPGESSLLDPSVFVRDGQLTVWFSVPSAAMIMQRLGALKPAAFPSLRLSLFCGEALPAALATSWAAAAPNSAVENLYGPTEATIACTAHSWEPAGRPGANGLVPIGIPMGSTAARVVDERLDDVPAGEPGQLLLSGPQVVAGYLDDEPSTSRSFVKLPDGDGYLTGDRVVRNADGGPLEYLGRLDSQIKVLGHRVELGEVEAVVREESGADVVAIGWPLTESGAAAIVAFIADGTLDTVALRRAIAARLPEYMVPRELRLVPELPLNPNGKRDRNALVALLQSE